MAFMTYFPLVATGVSLTIAGSAGYIDLLLSDQSMSDKIIQVADEVSDMESDVEDVLDGIEENEDSIEEIQKVLIQRQGKIDLDVQQLKNDIGAQDEKLDQLLGIVRSIQTQTR